MNLAAFGAFAWLCIVVLSVLIFLAPLMIWHHVAKIRQGMERQNSELNKKLDALVEELKRITGAA